MGERGVPQPTLLQWGQQEHGDCALVNVMRVWCTSLHSALEIQSVVPPCTLACMSMHASAALLPNVSAVLRPAGSHVGAEWLIEDGDSRGLDATVKVQDEAADWLQFFEQKAT